MLSLGHFIDKPLILLLIFNCFLRLGYGQTSSNIDSDQAQLLDLNRNMQEFGQKEDHPNVELYMDEILGVMKNANFPPEKIQERAHLRIQYSLSVKRLSSARDAAASWLKDHPQDEIARDMLGSINLQMDRKLEAMEAFKTLYEINPSLPIYRYKYLNILNLMDYQEESLELCDKIISSGSKDPKLLMEVIKSFLKFGKSEQALHEIDRYSILNPSDSFIHYARGQALHDTGKYEAAIDSLSKIPEKDPQWGDTAQLAGLCFTKLRKFDEAAQRYLRILTLYPYDTKTMQLLEQALARLQKREGSKIVQNIRQQVAKAILADEEAGYMGRSGDAAEHARLRSVALNATGYFRESEELLKEACKIVPDSIQAKTNLADFYIANLQACKAEPIFRLLAAQGPNEGKEDYLIQLATVLLRQSKVDEPLKILADSDKNFSFQQSLLELIGSFFLEIKGNPEQALVYLQKVENPSSQISSFIAKTFYLMGQYPESAKRFEALPGEFQDPTAQLFYAQVMAKLGKPEQAESLYRQVISHHPNLPILITQLAQAVIQSASNPNGPSKENEWTETIRSIRENVILAHQIGWPGSVPILLELSGLYRKAGDQNAAIRHAQLAFEGDPKRTDIRIQIIQLMNRPQDTFERLHQIHLAQQLDLSLRTFEQERLESLAYLQLNGMEQ